MPSSFICSMSFSGYSLACSISCTTGRTSRSTQVSHDRDDGLFFIVQLRHEETFRGGFRWFRRTGASRCRVTIGPGT